MSYRSLLNQTGTLLRRSSGVTELGERVETFTEHDVAAVTIQQETSPARLDEGGEDHRPTHKGFFPVELDVRVGDRFRLDGGPTLRVASVTDAAARGHHREARLFEVEC